MKERDILLYIFYTFSTWVQHGQKKIKFFYDLLVTFVPDLHVMCVQRHYFLFMLFFFVVVFILIF